MEGIRDGQAIDSCFYCALLYPTLDDCPRCGNRLHYESARMSDTLSAEECWQSLSQDFLATPDQAKAQALLELVHQYPEELEDRLSLPGNLSIDALRRAFESELPESEMSPGTTQSSEE